MSERHDLIGAVTESQRVLAGYLAQEQSQLILGSTLTMAQLKVLMLLRLHGQLGGNDLASHLQVSMPSVSGMVDRLVARGLVERREDPTDRGVRPIALSDRGEAMIAEHEAAGRQFNEEILDDLDVDELRILARGLAVAQRAVARRAERKGMRVVSPASCAETSGEDEASTTL